MGTSRGRLVALITLALCSAGLVVVLFEIGLALFAPVPHSIEYDMVYDADPYTGYRPRPGSRGFFQRGIPVRVNRHGHRGADTPLEKPEGVFRVLVLGDSFSMGVNVREEEAWPEVLIRLVRERTDRPVELVNAAVDGWDSFQYAQYFEHRGQAFTPDLVLVGFFVGNDVYSPGRSVDKLSRVVLGRRVSPGESARRYVGLKVALYEYSNLVRLLVPTGPRQGTDFTREHCNDFSAFHLAIQERRLANHIREDLIERLRDRLRPEFSAQQLARIQTLLAGRGVPLIAVLIPDETQVNPRLRSELLTVENREMLDFDMPQSMLVREFHRRGIETVDLLEVFRAHPCVYMNDTHWTAEGHDLAARAVVRELDRLWPR